MKHEINDTLDHNHASNVKEGRFDHWGPERGVRGCGLTGQNKYTVTVTVTVALVRKVV
jgi:hypothetical protein